MALLILVALALIFIVDVIIFSYEKYEWSITIMIAGIALAYFFTPHIKDFITHAGWLSILTCYLPGYLTLGLVTAVIKWSIFSVKHIGKIRRAKVAFDADDASSLVNARRIASGLFSEHTRAGWNDEANKRAVFVSFFKSGLEYGDASAKHIYTDGVDYRKDTAVVDALTPRAKENIGAISIWVFQWPVVIVSMLLSDLLVKIVDAVASVLDVLFSAINRKLVAGVTKGL